MDDAQEEEQQKKGEEEMIGWQVPEHNVYERGKKWYLGFSLVVAALLFYGIFSANFLFSVITVVAALIILLHDGQETPQVRFSITEEGVYVGKRFYDFDEFEQFAIVYKPGKDIKNLYLDFKSKLKPGITVSLEDKNPVYIRKILSENLDEDTERTDLSFSEEISRLLKI